MELAERRVGGGEGRQKDGCEQVRQLSDCGSKGECRLRYQPILATEDSRSGHDIYVSHEFSIKETSLWCRQANLFMDGAASHVCALTPQV